MVRAGLVCILLTVAVLVAFGQVLDHEFVNYDDDLYVTDNRHIQQGPTRQAVAWAFSTFHAGNWHPLTWMSHMLDIQLYALRPRGHHATNLALHIANTLLLLLFLWRTTGRAKPSIFVAAIFALHPLGVESVAWISERKNLLCGFFWMLTLCAYAHYAARPTAKRYVLVLITFAAGLLAKPMTVSLPAVLLLLDYWPLRRIRGAAQHPQTDSPIGGTSQGNVVQHPFKRLIWEKVPLVLLAAVSSGATVFAQRSADYVQPFHIFPVNVRLANIPLAYASYIGKLFWPQNLAVPYPHPGADIPRAAAVIAALALVAITVWAIRSRRTRPHVMVGWLWFLGTLVPVIGLVQVGPQSMADRYTYIPMIGLTMIVAWGAPALWQGPHRDRILAVAGVIIVPVLIVSTRQQVEHWKNSSTLWERALTVTDDNYIAHANLGRVHLTEGRLEEAGKQLTAALAIRYHPNFENNLGVVRYRQGRFQEAIAHHLKALESQPDLAEAHGNIGNILVSQGDIEEGVRHWREVLRIEPDNVRVRYNLAVIRHRQGRTQEAIDHLREALRLQPGFTEARAQLEKMLEQRGN